jgi:prophage antirepressor-like protein
MNDIQVFSSEEFGQIRTVTIEGKDYFYGVDIAEALMYKRPKKAVTDNCKGVLTQDTIKNKGGYLEPLIPEGDIYRLIIKASQQSTSKEIKKKAEKFEKWIFDDVVPSIRKHGTYTFPQTTQGQIQLLAQGYTEIKEEVDSIRTDLESLKMDLPILPVEADRITEAVRKKGVSILGGKQSKAYNERGLRQRVYNNLYGYLKYNFGIKAYKSLKRSQCDKAIEVINNYQVPFFLAEQIEQVNAQQTIEM